MKLRATEVQPCRFCGRRLNSQLHSAPLPCILENHEVQTIKDAAELLGTWPLVVRAGSFHAALWRVMGDDEGTK